MRYVSLPRLEREIARRQAARKPLDPAMLTLAGLQRVRYVFVYPESGDLVLAGPAGNWQVDAEGRILSTDTRRRSCGSMICWCCCVVAGTRPTATSGVRSIRGKRRSRRRKRFLASTSQKPLQPGQRKKWLGELRDTVGKQDIEVWGIDPASRAASVLVEADYHMKLVGMGLVEGVEGVESYLESIRLSERASRRRRCRCCGGGSR